jgi:FkbM family methyltransferase
MMPLAKFVTRSWPFANGSGRIIDKLFSDVNFEGQSAAVITSDSFPMMVPNDLIGRHLYISGKFDRSVVKVLCDHARPGDVLLDIGANIGYVSACFLKLVPNSKVVAVEPNPPVYEMLQSNLAQFTGRYHTVPVAMSDRDGDGKLATKDWNLGASSLADEGTPVLLWTAERLCTALNLDRIDLIKIDVEGHEEAVLRSLQPLLAQFKPRAILFEDHADRAATDIGELLNTAGYSVHGIYKSLLNTRVLPIRSKQDCTCNDYIAVRQDHNTPRRSR